VACPFCTKNGHSHHQSAFCRLQSLGGARADIDRFSSIWRQCLDAYGGPYLFGQRACAADAIYAPVCSRFETYDVTVDEDAAGYWSIQLLAERLDEAKGHRANSAKCPLYPNSGLD
jgi:glutathione S-transferase